MTYYQFLDLFEKGIGVDETTFYFKDDIKKSEHYIGYLLNGPLPQTPYWAGYCDLPDGFDCKTAKELFEAKIFNGKSIKDRWDDIIITSIGGISIEEWTDFNR